MRFSRLIWRIPVLAVAVVAWSAPVSASAQTVTGPSDWWITVPEDGTVTVRTYAQQYGIDSMLWLYTETGDLIAQNDDYYGLDSFLNVPVVAGNYRLRTGVCCGNPDAWYGQSYLLETNWDPAPPPTTTTLPEETTTTWEVTTTSTLPPTTSTTTAPTTNAPATDPPPPSEPEETTTTSTVLSPPSTLPAPPSEPPSDVTEPPATTNPPATSVVPTSPAPLGTTGPSSTSATLSVTSSLPSPASTSTTPSTVPPTSTTLLSDSSPVDDTPPPAPPNNASDEQKAAFEAQVNIFGDPAYDDYIPAGSLVTVAERRTIIAATTATAFALPTPTNRRRLK